MPEAKLKLMISSTAEALASIIACRSEPAPVFEAFVTVMVFGGIYSKAPMLGAVEERVTPR